MGILRKSAVAMMVLLIASMGVAFGQLQKRVNFDINVPYELRMTDYLLPPGHYVLYQVDPNAPNLFYLYRDNIRHTPIATVNTVRHDYVEPFYPSHTRIRLRIEETRTQGTEPVLRGWEIPGDDGWTIISVVPNKTSTLTRVQ